MSLKHLAGTLLGAAVLTVGCVGFAAGTASAAQAPSHVHTMATPECTDVAADVISNLRTAATGISSTDTDPLTIVGNVFTALNALRQAETDLNTIENQCVPASSVACNSLLSQAQSSALSALASLTGLAPDVANAFSQAEAAGGYAGILAGNGCLG